MESPQDLAEKYGCPLPPPDLAKRRMPERELQLASTSLLRIHRSVFDPIFYNRRSAGGSQYRFDAADDEFGVLYASPIFDVCMAETVIRGAFQGGTMPLTIDEDELLTRSISELGFEGGRPLLLADLTQPLFQLGFDIRVLSVEDYRGPNLWSSAIYEAFPHLDGLYFMSRYTNAPSVAIFERARLVARGEPVPLAKYHQLPGFLDRYQIGIAPTL